MNKFDIRKIITNMVNNNEENAIFELIFKGTPIKFNINIDTLNLTNYKMNLFIHQNKVTK